jgi:hypothetical protein
MLWFALAALLLAGPARAADGRSVDMTAVLHDESGRPARDVLARLPGDADCAHCPVLTLGRAAAHALFAAFPDERELPADQKWARAVLAARIENDTAARLDAEEIAVIKRLLGKAYGGVVLMQAYPLLDPNARPPAVK